MNKKLIMLVLCLPLVLMICLFSVSNSISVAISVPVSKIEIMSDNVVYMNFDIGEKYSIDYTVYPTNAKNKEVYFETEPVGNAPLAELEYIDGQIVAKSCGKAKVYLTTVDGGFRDSFIVQVESVRLHSIECSLNKSSIYVGETTQITTYFVPENSQTLLNYQVKPGSEDIVSVSAGGIVTGISKGMAEIEIVSADYNDVKDTVTIEIKNKDILDLESEEVVTWTKEGGVRISLDTEEDCEYTYSVVDKNGQVVDNSIVSIQLDLTNENNGRLVLNYSFIDKSFSGEVFVTVTAQTEGGLAVSKTCKISCIDKITARFESDVIKGLAVGRQTIEPFRVIPSDASVRYECFASNDNVSVEIKNNLPYITANKLGVSTISIKIYNAENNDEFVVISKDIVVTTTGLFIEESSNTYGIENVLAFGKTEVNGQPSTMDLTLSYGKVELGGKFVDVEAGEGFAENVDWISTSNNATINKNGQITLTGTGIQPEMVKFKAVFEYNNIMFESEEFAIKCVYEGINVRSYKDLWTVTNQENPKPIVLHKDIEEDFGVGVDSVYKQIDTTYDKTYYKNIGAEDKAKIKVLIEFKNDVYGNGHIINAHNVAYGLDNAGKLKDSAVFKGPLNFVAMAENGGLVSVKAQDNVCFAVYENVTLSNIELKGCNLQADGNNEYDLTDLTYVGTTVEAFGDNINIQYSRITNGRTVLRAFGDIADNTKNIHLNIENSILSGAREFIMRLGSNCFVEGTKENVSPYLDNKQQTFPAQKAYELLNETERETYENAYIKTFVNVKNSVLKDAGIFAIALDAHFAGPALEDGSSYLNGLVESWKDLAKTSYGVKLSFEDDVRMYCWKNIGTIDSSTLIETHEFSAFKDIEFNVGEMVETISNNPKFTDIIYQDNSSGIKYVHANIAFFGGGKNYSVFESNYTTNFNGYEISLSEVNKTVLQTAAGNESFYFMLNDATTQNFLPEHQEQILKTKEAYSCIYKK